MMRKVLFGLSMASGAVGVVACNGGLGAPSSSVVEAQVEYNLTIADDRAKFREEGMAYLGSVGPYAVYKITGTSPKLVGPYVKAPSSYGYAMACGAAHYFSSLAKTAISPAAGLQLRGGRAGTQVLVDVAQMPQDQGGCTSPQDTFGNPVPDGGSSGGGTPGDGSGGTGCTSPEGGCGTPGGGTSGGSTGGGTPGDGDSGDTGVQQIGLTVSPPPPMGSTVLLRRVAITAAREHNGSHVEPSICCTDDVCALQ
jgi:hypothetical protein